MRQSIKNRLTTLLAIAGTLICIAAVAIGAAIEDRGAEIILIDGGKSRDVHFPHHKHQNALDNCNICHHLFPKKNGSIKELKEQGQLKKKQVMREHCIDCHKKLKAEGKKTGPTSCGRCHRTSG